MRYLDTSVIISAVNLEDLNHERALKLLDHDRKVVSDLTKVEICSVASRTIGISGEELDALVEYMIEVSGAKLVPADWSYALRTACSLAGELKLKSLDLLHISAALSVGAREFATLDEDPIRRRERIRELTGIEVVF